MDYLRASDILADLANTSINRTIEPFSTRLVPIPQSGAGVSSTQIYDLEDADGVQRIQQCSITTQGYSATREQRRTSDLDDSYSQSPSQLLKTIFVPSNGNKSYVKQETVDDSQKTASNSSLTENTDSSVIIDSTKMESYLEGLKTSTDTDNAVKETTLRLLDAQMPSPGGYPTNAIDRLPEENYKQQAAAFNHQQRSENTVIASVIGTQTNNNINVRENKGIYQTYSLFNSLTNADGAAQQPPTNYQEPPFLLRTRNKYTIAHTVNRGPDRVGNLTQLDLEVFSHTNSDIEHDIQAAIPEERRLTSTSNNSFTVVADTRSYSNPRLVSWADKFYFGNWVRGKVRYCPDPKILNQSKFNTYMYKTLFFLSLRDLNGLSREEEDRLVHSLTKLNISEMYNSNLMPLWYNIITMYNIARYTESTLPVYLDTQEIRNHFTINNRIFFTDRDANRSLVEVLNDIDDYNDDIVAKFRNHNVIVITPDSLQQLYFFLGMLYLPFLRSGVDLFNEPLSHIYYDLRDVVVICYCSTTISTSYDNGVNIPSRDILVTDGQPNHNVPDYYLICTSSGIESTITCNSHLFMNKEEYEYVLSLYKYVITNPHCVDLPRLPFSGRHTLVYWLNNHYSNCKSSMFDFNLTKPLSLPDSVYISPTDRITLLVKHADIMDIWLSQVIAEEELSGIDPYLHGAMLDLHNIKFILHNLPYSILNAYCDKYALHKHANYAYHNIQRNGYMLYGQYRHIGKTPLTTGNTLRVSAFLNLKTQSALPWMHLMINGNKIDDLRKYGQISTKVSRACLCYQFNSRDWWENFPSSLYTRHLGSNTRKVTDGVNPARHGAVLSLAGNSVAIYTLILCFVFEDNNNTPPSYFRSRLYIRPERVNPNRTNARVSAGSYHTNSRRVQNAFRLHDRYNRDHPLGNDYDGIGASSSLIYKLSPKLLKNNSTKSTTQSDSHSSDDEIQLEDQFYVKASPVLDVTSQRKEKRSDTSHSPVPLSLDTFINITTPIINKNDMAGLFARIPLSSYSEDNDGACRVESKNEYCVSNVLPSRKYNYFSYQHVFKDCNLVPSTDDCFIHAVTRYLDTFKLKLGSIPNYLESTYVRRYGHKPSGNDIPHYMKRLTSNSLELHKRTFDMILQCGENIDKNSSLTGVPLASVHEILTSSDIPVILINFSEDGEYFQTFLYNIYTWKEFLDILLHIGILVLIDSHYYYGKMSLLSWYITNDFVDYVSNYCNKNNIASVDGLGISSLVSWLLWLLNNANIRIDVQNPVCLATNPSLRQFNFKDLISENTPKDINVFNIESELITDELFVGAPNNSTRPSSQTMLVPRSHSQVVTTPHSAATQSSSDEVVNNQVLVTSLTNSVSSNITLHLTSWIFEAFPDINSYIEASKVCAALSSILIMSFDSTWIEDCTPEKFARVQHNTNMCKSGSGVKGAGKHSVNSQSDHQLHNRPSSQFTTDANPGKLYNTQYLDIVPSLFSGYENESYMFAVLRSIIKVLGSADYINILSNCDIVSDNFDKAALKISDTSQSNSATDCCLDPNQVLDDVILHISECLETMAASNLNCTQDAILLDILNQILIPSVTYRYTNSQFKSAWITYIIIFSALLLFDIDACNDRAYVDTPEKLHNIGDVAKSLHNSVTYPLITNCLLFKMIRLEPIIINTIVLVIKISILKLLKLVALQCYTRWSTSSRSYTLKTASLESLGVRVPFPMNNSDKSYTDFNFNIMLAICWLLQLTNQVKDFDEIGRNYQSLVNDLTPKHANIGIFDRIGTLVAGTSSNIDISVGDHDTGLILVCSTATIMQVFQAHGTSGEVLFPEYMLHRKYHNVSGATAIGLFNLGQDPIAGIPAENTTITPTSNIYESRKMFYDISCKTAGLSEPCRLGDVVVPCLSSFYNNSVYKPRDLIYLGNDKYTSNRSCYGCVTVGLHLVNKYPLNNKGNTTFLGHSFKTEYNSALEKEDPSLSLENDSYVEVHQADVQSDPSHNVNLSSIIPDDDNLKGIDHELEANTETISINKPLRGANTPIHSEDALTISSTPGVNMFTVNKYLGCSRYTQLLRDITQSMILVFGCRSNSVSNLTIMRFLAIIDKLYYANFENKQSHINIVPEYIDVKAKKLYLYSFQDAVPTGEAIEVKGNNYIGVRFIDYLRYVYSSVTQQVIPNMDVVATLALPNTSKLLKKEFDIDLTPPSSINIHSILARINHLHSNQGWNGFPFAGSDSGLLNYASYVLPAATVTYFSFNNHIAQQYSNIFGNMLSNCYSRCSNPYLDYRLLLDWCYVELDRAGTLKQLEACKDATCHIDVVELYLLYNLYYNCTNIKSALKRISEFSKTNYTNWCGMWLLDMGSSYDLAKITLFLRWNKCNSISFRWHWRSKDAIHPTTWSKAFSSANTLLCFNPISSVLTSINKNLVTQVNNIKTNKIRLQSSSNSVVATLVSMPDINIPNRYDLYGYLASVCARASNIVDTHVYNKLACIDLGLACHYVQYFRWNRAKEKFPSVRFSPYHRFHRDINDTAYIHIANISYLGFKMLATYSATNAQCHENRVYETFFRGSVFSEKVLSHIHYYFTQTDNQLPIMEIQGLSVDSLQRLISVITSISTYINGYSRVNIGSVLNVRNLSCVLGMRHLHSYDDEAAYSDDSWADMEVLNPSDHRARSLDRRHSFNRCSYPRQYGEYHRYSRDSDVESEHKALSRLPNRESQMRNHRLIRKKSYNSISSYGNCSSTSSESYFEGNSGHLLANSNETSFEREQYSTRGIPHIARDDHDSRMYIDKDNDLTISRHMGKQIVGDIEIDSLASDYYPRKTHQPLCKGKKKTQHHYTHSADF